MKRSFLMLCLGAASLAGAQANVANVIESRQVRGDFVTTGASTRVLGGAQLENFELVLADIPVGATVVSAYANWSYLSNNEDQAAEAQIFINGQSVLGTESGRAEPDLLWNRDFTVGYTANITDLVTGNGSYIINSATDEPSGGVGALGEGISILAIYELPNAAMKQVNVYDGMWTTTSDSGPWTLNLPGPYEDRGAHLFTNALDGQDIFSDDWLINSQTASQLLPGGATNAWRGELGPGGIGQNYYDHFDGEVGAFMFPGMTSFTLETYGFTNQDPLYTDTVGHSFAALSYGAVPEPASVLAILLGLGGIARKTRRGAKS